MPCGPCGVCCVGELIYGKLDSLFFIMKLEIKT